MLHFGGFLRYVLTVIFFLLLFWPVSEESISRTGDASPQLALSSDPCDLSEYCTTGENTSYPGNCQKYYWCVNSVWQAVDCAAGTSFDNVTKECVLPSTARCQPECPPVTATTPPRSTIDPGACDEDNVTSCANNQIDKYPDRSSCVHYYLCTGNRLVRVQCSTGTVFYIDRADCFEPDSSFDCYYRCRTPAPPTTEERSTTRNPAGTTTPSLGTDATRVPTPATIGTTAIIVTTDISAVGPPLLPTANPPSSGLGVGAIVGIVLGSILVILAIILLIIWLIKRNKRNNKVAPPPELHSIDDAPSEVGSDDPGDVNHNDTDYLVKTNQVLKVEPNKPPLTLPPLELPNPELKNEKNETKSQKKKKETKQRPPEKTTAIYFTRKSEKLKRKALKPFQRVHPSRDEAMQSIVTYKKSLKKQLRRRYEAEENKWNSKYEERLNKQTEAELAQRNEFEGRLFDADCSADERVGLIRGYLNDTAKSREAREVILDAKDKVLLVRLKEKNLSPDEMKQYGLSPSDLDEKTMAKKNEEYNEACEKLRIKFQQDVQHRTDVDDIRTLLESYQKKQEELQKGHLEYRKKHSEKLQSVLRKIGLKKLDNSWTQICQEMDKTYEYPMATDSPAQLHETLDKHMAALQEVGEKMNVAFEEEAAGHDSMTKVVNSFTMDEQGNPKGGTTVISQTTRKTMERRKSVAWGMNTTSTISVDESSSPPTQQSFNTADAAGSKLPSEGQGAKVPPSILVTRQSTSDTLNARRRQSTTALPVAAELTTTITRPDSASSDDADSRDGEFANGGLYGTTMMAAPRRIPRNSVSIYLAREQQKIMEAYQQENQHLAAVRQREKTYADDLIKRKLSQVHPPNQDELIHRN